MASKETQPCGGCPHAGGFDVCTVCSDDYGTGGGINELPSDCTEQLNVCAGGAPDAYSVDFEGVSWSTAADPNTVTVTDGTYVFNLHPTQCHWSAVVSVTWSGRTWSTAATLTITESFGTPLMTVTIAHPWFNDGLDQHIGRARVAVPRSAEGCTSGVCGDCHLLLGNLAFSSGAGNGALTWDTTGHMNVAASGSTKTYTNGETVTTGTTQCGSTANVSGIGSVKGYANGLELTGGDGVSAGSGKVTLDTVAGDEAAIVDVVLNVNANDYLQFKWTSPTDGNSLTAILDLRPGTYSGEAYDVDFGFTDLHGVSVAAADRTRIETYAGPYIGLRVSFCLTQEDKAIMRISAANLRERCMQAVPYDEHSTDYDFSIEAVEGTAVVHSVALQKHGKDTAGCAECSTCGDVSVDPACVRCSGEDCDWQVIDGTWNTEGFTFIPEADTATILTADTAGGPSSRMFTADLWLQRNVGADVDVILGWDDSSNYLFVKFTRNVDCLYMRLGKVAGGTPAYEGTSRLIHKFDATESTSFRVVLSRINNGVTDTIHAHVPEYGAYVTWDTGSNLFATNGHDEFGFRSYGGANTMAANNAQLLTVYVDDDATTWDCPPVATEPDCGTTGECCSECQRGTWPNYIEVALGHGIAGNACCNNYTGGRYILQPVDRNGTDADMCTYTLSSSDTICGDDIDLEVRIWNGSEWLLRVELSPSPPDNYSEWDTFILTHAYPLDCKAFINGCGGGWDIKNSKYKKNCTHAGVYARSCDTIPCGKWELPTVET